MVHVGHVMPWLAMSANLWKLYELNDCILIIRKYDVILRACPEGVLPVIWLAETLRVLDRVGLTQSLCWWVLASSPCTSMRLG